MDGIPISGLPELENHMEQLAEAPDTPVDAKLFDDVELQLTGRSVQSSTTTKKLWSGSVSLLFYSFTFGICCVCCFTLFVSQ
jgi:hypothetical protein